MPRPLTSLILALALSSSSGAALMAQPVAQPAHAIGDVSAFHGTPATLIKIIHDVEQTNPGRVIEIRFDNSSGTPGFMVALYQHGQVNFLRLEHEGGQLVPVSEDTQAVWIMNMRKMDNTRLAAKARSVSPTRFRRPSRIRTAIRPWRRASRWAPAIRPRTFTPTTSSSCKRTEPPTGSPSTARVAR